MPSKYIAWHGKDVPPDPAKEVRAGNARALVVGPDLRRVRIGVNELVQRVYVAVRDKSWNTITAEYSNFHYDIQEDSFSVIFTAHHQYEDIDFEWLGKISGEKTGVIEYHMLGKANCDFAFNKIGFNVHHSLKESIGAAYRASAGDQEFAGRIPVYIDPQRVENGTLTAMFEPYDKLQLVVSDDLTVDFEFEGDLFEMQDHRNWTDANFKSYGTPLRVPYPMYAKKDQVLEQRVRIIPRYTRDLDETFDQTISIVLGDVTNKHIPPIGFSMSSVSSENSRKESHLLKLLKPGHIRWELHLTKPDWIVSWTHSLEISEELGVPLELALFVSDKGPYDQVNILADFLKTRSNQVARIFVLVEPSGFTDSSMCTPLELVQTVREIIEPQVSQKVVICGGTNKFFAEVNRDRPEDPQYGGVVYSVNPQVHAYDDMSLMENAYGQQDTVRTARSIVGDQPVFVSPITILSREGPYAGGPSKPGDLPPNVDVRHASLWGSAWTVASLSQMAFSSANALTYFETTGWRGLIESSHGSADPRYPSKAGDIFPIYYVFRSLAERKHGLLMELSNSKTDQLAAFALKDDIGVSLLLSNLTFEKQYVNISGLPFGYTSVLVLDETTISQVKSDINWFNASKKQIERAEELSMQLLPMAMVLIEINQYGDEQKWQK